MTLRGTMSICEKCASVAKENRARFDEIGRRSRNMRKHPQNCGCPCQHLKVEQWQKQFSTEQPGE